MCLYIGMAIFGIIALVRGKLPLTRNKIVVGIPARLLGALALTPFPLALAAVTLFMVAKGGLDNPEQFQREHGGTTTAIQLACAFGVLILIFVIGFVVAVNPAEAKRRERGDRYEEDEDDRDDDRRGRRDSDDRDDDHDDRDDRRDRDAKPWNR